MSLPHPLLTPLRQAIRAGVAQKLPCLVGLRADEAPAAAAKVRPPLNLAVVLDVSPSMAGQSIAQAREAALLLIQRLAATDRVALITYATTAEVLMPSSVVGEARDEACRRLRQVTVREASTALHAGWLHGAQAIAPHVAPGITSRVLLLSDGQANAGETRLPQLGEGAQRLREEAGITTSTYGIGQSFNEDLMTLMGECGGGQAFYANEASELAGYFDTELNLLTHAVARQVSVTLDAGATALPTTWLTGRTRQDGTVALGDVVAGATSWALVEFDLPALAQGTGVDLSAVISWTDSEGAPQRQTVQVRVTTQAEAGEEDPVVAERVRETEAARLQRAARTMVSSGNWDGARVVLGNLQAMAGQNAYVSSVSSTLNNLLERGDAQAFAKEASYASHTMSTRAFHNHEDVTQMTDVLGLRKAVQGKASPTTRPQS